MEYELATAYRDGYGSTYWSGKIVSKRRVRRFLMSIIPRIADLSECFSELGWSVTVNTVLKRRSPIVCGRQVPILRRLDVHCMVLDCDCERHALAASAMLMEDNIGFVQIASGTPGHFWFITDYTGPFSKVYAKLETVVGVDQAYVRACGEWRRLHLRAVPFIGRVPTFPNDHGTLKSDITIQWYYQFKYWYQEEMAAVLRNMVYQQALVNGNAELLADPTNWK